MNAIHNGQTSIEEILRETMLDDHLVSVVSCQLSVVSCQLSVAKGIRMARSQL